MFVELAGHLELPSWVTGLKGAALLPLSISVPAWQKEKPSRTNNAENTCEKIVQWLKKQQKNLREMKCKELNIREGKKEKLRSLPPCLIPALIFVICSCFMAPSLPAPYVVTELTHAIHILKGHGDYLLDNKKVFVGIRVCDDSCSAICPCL